MLKTDFNGYAEFAEKILKAENKPEMGKLCIERAQIWMNKLQDALFPILEADEPFLLTALYTLTETLEKDSPEAILMAKKIKAGLDYKVKTETISGDMTEAAARAYAETMRKK